MEDHQGQRVSRFFAYYASDLSRLEPPDNQSAAEKRATKPLRWVHPLIWRVTQSEVCNDSYHVIKTKWTVGDLVEALRLTSYHQAIHEIERKKHDKKRALRDHPGI